MRTLGAIQIVTMLCVYWCMGIIAYCYGTLDVSMTDIILEGGGLVAFSLIAIFAIVRNPHFGGIPFSVSIEPGAMGLEYSQSTFRVARDRIKKVNLLVTQGRVCMIKIWCDDGRRIWIPDFNGMLKVLDWIEVNSPVPIVRKKRYIRPGSLVEAVPLIILSAFIGCFLFFMGDFFRAITGR